MNQRLKEELLITKPAKPPLDEFQVYLEKIWNSRWLTNNGPFHEEFEQALCDYLGVKYISLFANGTLALTIALKLLNLKGEVITTPFTSIETTQAIYWNQLHPVFADISPDDLNIDVSKIEELVTPDTCAILPVHVFGSPCNLDGINDLARKFQLKLIYDAAHCFGVEYDGLPICDFGDLSVLSFHATKVFNTIEGGAIICHDKQTKDKIDALKNSGKMPGYQLSGFGLNAKLNEVQSAYGLALLKYVDEHIKQRKNATNRYRELLKNVSGLKMHDEKGNVKYNYSYFPILIDPNEFGATRDELMDYLEKNNIQTKKYFHPLVSDYTEFGKYKTGDLSVAMRIAENIICLPLFHDITIAEQNAVVDIILESKSAFVRKVSKC
jgi:dTDP-4-amino-4,6-dideoxygalactose transaminase